jgi:hypothetical protein
MIHETLPNKRKLLKNAKPTYKISSSFNGFFFKIIFLNKCYYIKKFNQKM